MLRVMMDSCDVSFTPVVPGEDRRVGSPTPVVLGEDRRATSPTPVIRSERYMIGGGCSAVGVVAAREVVCLSGVLVVSLAADAYIFISRVLGVRVMVLLRGGRCRGDSVLVVSAGA